MSPEKANYVIEQLRELFKSPGKFLGEPKDAREMRTPGAPVIESIQFISPRNQIFVVIFTTINHRVGIKIKVPMGEDSIDAIADKDADALVQKVALLLRIEADAFKPISIFSAQKDKVRA